MAAGDLFWLQVQSSSQGRKMTNNWGYRQSTPGDVPLTPEILCRAWEAQKLTGYKALLSATVQVECVYSRGVERGMFIPFEIPFQAQMGTRALAAQPNNVAFTYKLTTDSNSSLDNGTSFISGIADGDILDGKLDPAYEVAAVNPFAIELLEPLTGVPPDAGDYDLVVIDQIFEGNKLIPKQSHKVVTISWVSEVFGQARRTTRHTRNPTPALP